MRGTGERTRVDLTGVDDGVEAPGTVPTRRVLVAGGRRLMRESVAALLTAAPHLEVVGATGDELATLAALDRTAVDVLVCHAFLGDTGGGPRLAVALRESHPCIGVVLLLGDGDAAEVERVLDQGTARRALLLMDHPSCTEDLVRAVDEVATGGSIVHPGVVDLILGARQTVEPLQVLTPRERAVLSAIASGASNRAVAESLGLSDRAVEKHINQLYAKLGLPADGSTHRRVAAVLTALGHPHGLRTGLEPG